MTHTPPPTRQRGFAAIAAVFLVVVLAALGAYMATLSNAQHLASAQDVQGTRAYWAARAGLSRAIVSTPATGAAPVCPAIAPWVVEGFTVTVGCTLTAYLDGAGTVALYRYTVIASQGAVGTVNYVERSVGATLER